MGVSQEYRRVYCLLPIYTSYVGCGPVEFEVFCGLGWRAVYLRILGDNSRLTLSSLASGGLERTTSFPLSQYCGGFSHSGMCEIQRSIYLGYGRRFGSSSSIGCSRPCRSRLPRKRQEDSDCGGNPTTGARGIEGDPRRLVRCTCHI